MEYLEEKSLYDTPKYYRNPTGVGAFSNLGNAVRKGRGELILTTEYVDLKTSTLTDSFPGFYYTYRLVFEKLKNEIVGTIVGINPQGNAYGLQGFLIRGLVFFENGISAGFNTSIVPTLESNPYTDTFTAALERRGRVITLVISTNLSLKIVNARLRVSQTQ